MTCTYQIDEADFVSAGKLLLRTRRGARARRFVLNGCWVLVVAGMAVLLLLRHWTAVPFFGLFLLLYTLLLSSVGWQYRRQYRKLPALHGPRSLEADETGLHLVSSHADSRFSWQVLERSAENDRVFILVQQGGRIFFPIAKRQLTLEQTAGLRELFAQHISSK